MPPRVPAAPVAVSSMWSMQPRFERADGPDGPQALAALAEFVRAVAAMGYQAIEINPSMTAAQAATLRVGPLSIASVHAPAPVAAADAARWNRVNLASLDEAERAAAVAAARGSIALARTAGARHVVLHLGDAGDATLDGDRRLREAFRAGVTSGEAWEQAQHEARTQRAALAARHLPQAARSLRALAGAAQDAGVTLGLECRLEYHHIPLPAEAAALLAGYPREVAGYWHDVGHAEVLHRLGLVPLEQWWALVGERLVGLHVHDVRGITDHRAPGNGDVDFRALAARIPPGAAITLEVDEREPAADLARALDVLRAAGVVE